MRPESVQIMMVRPLDSNGERRVRTQAARVVSLFADRDARGEGRRRDRYAMDLRNHAACNIMHNLELHGRSVRSAAPALKERSVILTLAYFGGAGT